ncbi:MAG TPA: hypothetical protein DCG19_05250 [Cryomorphaceae bacterium]|nr:hypothetical protein [Owenweeksia sp.]MBF98894.1 hypothetical protein [Owenweeksia sp.]HAD96791.1 hypothetical protein [Cryomorphaceae bacterium]HBF21346.1 hypothetical protein [Cryomorphaceae bacterium]|tara:strand:- start:173 stop:1696 length:1524 start_codon:yes stop_codon:yes gene_type:complete
MRKIFLFLTLQFAVGQLFTQAQQLEMKLGPDMDYSSYTSFKSFLGATDNFIYTWGSKKNDIYIYEYDKSDLKLQYKVLVKKNINSTTVYTGYEFMGDDLLLFYEGFDKKKSQNTLSVRTLTSNGQLSNPEIIARSDSDKKGRGGFYQTISPNQKNLALYIVPPPSEQEKESSKFSMAVYDTDYQLKWESNYELPYTNENFFLTKFYVSDEGEVFAFAKVSNVKAVLASNYRENWILLKLSANGEYKLIDLEVFEDDFSKYRLRLNTPKGKFSVYAMAEASYKYDNQTGIFMAIADMKTFELEHKVLLEFDEATRRSLTEEDRIDGKPQEFFDFKPISIQSRHDSSGIVIAIEKQYTQSSDMGNSVTSNEYFTRDIIIMAVSNSGRLKSTYIIPKDQQAEGDEYNKSSSLLMLDKSDNIHVFFNDEPENQNFKPGRGKEPAKMKDPAKSALVHYTIESATGEGKYQILRTNSKNSLPEVRNFRPIYDHNQILIIIEQGKKMKLGTLQL